MNWKKIVLILVIAGVALTGGGYVSYRVYRSMRQARLVKQARTFLEQSNTRKALLALQRALKHNPKDVDACRLMAEFSESVGSPAALVWRSRVVEINPDSAEDRFALVRTAMTYRNYGIATNALEGVSAASRKSAAFHELAGALALPVRQFAQAEAHFQEAARLEPTNPVPQMKLAVVRLYGSNTQAQAEARTSLTRLASTYPVMRAQVLRELLMDAVRYRQTNSALALAKDLVQQTNAGFADRILRLDVLHATRNPEFKSALAAYQHEAGTDQSRIFELGKWEKENLGPAETLAWLRAQPPLVQTNHPVALLVAQCRLDLRDWKNLQASLEGQHWGELEFLRHALKAHALRGQNLAAASKTEWDLAVKIASNQKGSLDMLLQLAVQWNWQGEMEEILWSIVNQNPNDKAAAQALTEVLFLGGRTRPLMMLYGQQAKRAPNDLSIKNNLAVTALLLDARELKPHELAHDVYLKAPTNAAFASTYAFSLYLQSKPADALKIIQQLKPQELEASSIAGYYGLILKATGNGPKAKSFLELALKGPLLPEERKLFERARTGA